MNEDKESSGTRAVCVAAGHEGRRLEWQQGVCSEKPRIRKSKTQGIQE